MIAIRVACFFIVFPPKIFKTSSSEVCSVEEILYGFICVSQLCRDDDMHTSGLRRPFPILVLPLRRACRHRGISCGSGIRKAGSPGLGYRPEGLFALNCGS